MITSEKAENHEYYLEEVGQYRCPHVAEKIEYLALDDCKLVSWKRKMETKRPSRQEDENKLSISNFIVNAKTIIIINWLFIMDDWYFFFQLVFFFVSVFLLGFCTFSISVLMIFAAILNHELEPCAQCDPLHASN